MKTFKNLLAIVLISILNFNSYGALVVPATPVVENHSTRSGHLIKAVFANGIWMPVVDLPEFEVIGTRNGSVVLKAVKRDGELIALVELPVIIIKGDRIQVDTPISNNINTYETIHDLPVIEIESTFPVQKLIKSEYSVDEYIAVIDLPEITITIGGNSDDVQAYQPNIISNLENESTFQFHSIDVNNTSYAIINPLNELQMSSIYSVSLENCFINTQRKRICNLVLKLGQNVGEGIKTNLVQIVTP